MIVLVEFVAEPVEAAVVLVVIAAFVVDLLDFLLGFELVEFAVELVEAAAVLAAFAVGLHLLELLEPLVVLVEQNS
ncbi:hypothetical protein [Bacillus taeanensis]|uniref:hypothetical protein n=1 Tax=Bacillus taeanensis TaxID=273032 RepID=UPI0015F085DB|nr:hypothetical protein [Bacillus taeanensis]